MTRRRSCLAVTSQALRLASIGLAWQGFRSIRYSDSNALNLARFAHGSRAQHDAANEQRSDDDDGERRRMKRGRGWGRPRSLAPTS